MDRSTFPTMARLRSPVSAEKKVTDAMAAPCALPTLCRLAGDVLSSLAGAGWGPAACGTTCTLGSWHSGDSTALQDAGQPH